MIEDRCGRYELLMPVAHGGMGTVWVARSKGDRDSSRMVAIKTMLPKFAWDPHFQRMFRIEAELASRIGHPNVCGILGLDEEPGQGLCLVMEWIEGSSLQAVLDVCREQKRPVPYGIAARIGAQAARGLHAAHELCDERGARIGLVHRDVSPHNIIVSNQGVVKIIDFGIAKAVERFDNPTTVSGQIKGKMRYLSPEQVACEPLDHRADIFPLGIVLYQLVTGVHPFEANHEVATMRRIVAVEPHPPLERVPDCPPELSAVIMRALAKDRAERLASMSDLANTLEALAAALGTSDADVAAFIREVVGARIAARTARIEASVRMRDAVRALITPGAPAAAPPRRRWALAAAGLCALGAVLGVGLGAAYVAWLDPPARLTLESADLSVPPVAAMVISLEAAPHADPAPPPTSAPRTGLVTPAAASLRNESRVRFRSPGF